MPTVEFGGESFNVDEDGFIDDYKNWNEQWVQYVKKEEGIDELNEEHKLVIEVLREYYEKNGIAPMVRVLSKVTGFKLKHIYELFPQARAREPVRWPVCRNPPVASNPSF
jgi:TusE/DsrC/DsvC family sulfur relay protein